MHEGHDCVWKLVTDDWLLNNVISLVLKIWIGCYCWWKSLTIRSKQFFPFKLCHRTRPTRTILKSELSSNIFIMKNDYETHWKKSLAVTPSIFSLCRCGVFKAQYKRPTILVGNVRCFVSIRHLCDDNCVLGSWFASQTKCHIELGKRIKGIPNYVINHI